MSVMTDYQENFIRNMKFYRKKAGFSQAKLAELCDVSNGTIGNIECGFTKPSFDLIFMIAEAVQVRPEDLFKTEHTEEDFTTSQLERVSEKVNSAVQDAVAKAITELKFSIRH